MCRYFSPNSSSSHLLSRSCKNGMVTIFNVQIPWDHLNSIIKDDQDINQKVKSDCFQVVEPSVIFFHSFLVFSFSFNFSTMKFFHQKNTYLYILACFHKFYKHPKYVKKRPTSKKISPNASICFSTFPNFYSG